MAFDIDALNSACMRAFKESVTFHLGGGDTVVDGVYSEIPDDGSFEGTDVMRTIYRLELFPAAASLLSKGDQLTTSGGRFAFINSTPNNGLVMCELRKV